MRTSSLESRSEEARRGLKRYLSWVVFAGFFIWVFLYIHSHYEDFLVIRDLSLRYIVILLSLAILSFTVNGIFTRTMVRSYGIRLGFFEAFSISLISLVGNYIMPFRGGLGLRALYLKKRHSLSYRRFTKILAGRFVVVFFVESLFGLVNQGILWKYYGMFQPVFLILLGTAFFFSLYVLFSPNAGRNPRLFKRVTTLIGSVSETVRRDNSTGKLLLIASATSLVRVLIISFAFRSIGTILAPPQAILISTLIPFSMIISITPGNVGITEGVFLFSTGFLGIRPAVALISATIVRFSFLFWSFLGIFLMKYWMREPMEEVSKPATNLE